MNIKEFSKYWNILKKNYQDKTHNKEELYTYYSIFKDYDEEIFKLAIKEVLLHQKYFPRIDEIFQYIPEETPSWFDKELKVESTSDEEQKEMEELLDELNNLHR